MKKLFLIIAVVCMALSTHATDYSWVVIHQTNGADTYMKANGAYFSVNNGQLTVTHADGTFSSSISDLSYMAFTGDPAGVDYIFSADSGEVEIYSDQGLYIGRYNSADDAREAISTSGMYVFKTRKGTAKILITK